MSGRARRSCGGGGVGEEKGRAEAREGRLEHLHSRTSSLDIGSISRRFTDIELL